MLAIRTLLYSIKSEVRLAEQNDGPVKTGAGEDAV